MATQGPRCPRRWPSVERHPARGSHPMRSGQGATSQPGSGLLCGWKLGWSPGGFYSARCALPGAGAPPTSRSSAPRKQAVISGASCSRQIRESPVSSDPPACRWAWVLVLGHLSLRWEQPASSPRLATWLSGFRAHAGGTAGAHLAGVLLLGAAGSRLSLAVPRHTRAVCVRQLGGGQLWTKWRNYFIF